MSGMDHSIGALARLGGVSVKTVRHYSDQGLLASRRTAAGHRRYSANAFEASSAASETSSAVAQWNEVGSSLPFAGLIAGTAFPAGLTRR